MKKKLMGYLFAIAMMSVGCQEVPEDLLAKQYSPEELHDQICFTPKKCVETESEIWFIDSGFLFSYDKSTWVKSNKKAFDVKEIVNYQNIIVGLQNHGGVYIEAKTKSGEPIWHKIGSGIFSIYSVNSNLLALSTNGELFSHQKINEEVTGLNLEPSTQVTGAIVANEVMGVSASTYLIPSIQGKQVALESAGILDIDIKSVLEDESALSFSFKDSSLPRIEIIKND